jgi:hypothetical protein
VIVLEDNAIAIPANLKLSHRRDQLIDVERFQGGLEVLALIMRSPAPTTLAERAVPS